MRAHFQIAALAVLVVGLQLPARANSAQGGGQKHWANTSFVISVVAHDGQQRREGTVWLSGRKFREEIRHLSGGTETRTLRVFNGSEPEIVWGMEFASQKAWPSLESCFRALARYARKHGEAQTRETFQIPREGFPAGLQGFLKRPVQPEILNGTLDLPPLPRQPVRRESVAGMACEVFDLRDPNRPDAAGHPGREVTLWRHRATGLVLKMVERFPPAGPVPARKREFRVTSLKQVSQIPDTQFALPPGSKAHVPLLFEGVKLPMGVARITPQDPFRLTGVGFGATR